MRIHPLWGLPNLLVAASCIILAGCGGGSDPVVSVQKSTPTFKMVVDPATQTVKQGQATNYTFTLTAENGFATGVTPAVAGLPAGTKATFAPASVVPTVAGATTIMTVTTTDQGGSAEPTPAGRSTLTISAGSGSVSRQVTTSLVVTA